MYSYTKTDFGARFYLLPSFFNAKDWVCRKPSNCGRGVVMIYNLHPPGDFLAMDLTSDDEKWREVVQCARRGIDIHVEDEIEKCNCIFGNMSGDRTVPHEQ